MKIVCIACVVAVLCSWTIGINTVNKLERLNAESNKLTQRHYELEKDRLLKELKQCNIKRAMQETLIKK